MKLLAIRFSAMGDVALTVPVLRAVLKANPSLEITFVSNNKFAPLFNDIPRLNFTGINLNKYIGISGLLRLAKELKNEVQWDVVLDLHSVLRTWVIMFVFKTSGLKVYSIDKGRKEKKALTRKENKVRSELKHSTIRYLDVFHEAGLHGQLEDGVFIKPKISANASLASKAETLALDQNLKWIGIAPFSKHSEKEWPIDNIKAVIEQLVKKKDCQVLLFGGGQEERNKLEAIARGQKNVISIAGKLDLTLEIALIHKLELMVAMDSFNMHLAALCGVKTISIWGATHPYAGFGPLNNNVINILQISTDHLPCRPCSVFGNKPCHRRDFACMNQISVAQVVDKIYS